MMSRNVLFMEVLNKVEKDIINNFHSQRGNIISSINLFKNSEPKRTLTNNISISKNTSLNELHLKHQNFSSNKKRPYSKKLIKDNTTSFDIPTPPITMHLKPSNYYKGGHNSKEYRSLVRNITTLLKHIKIDLFDIDDYKILKQVGEGSYGKIYLVEDSKTLKKCALKKIIAHTYNEVDMLLNEFSLVRSVKHSNIMKIYGICVRILDVTTIAISVLMEMANSDWDSEIRKRKDKNDLYTEDELVSILTQLVSALAFMEENKISHRDIKPQNVLIFRHGVFKVADFGEAKEVKVAKQLNTLRGTEFYMSPLLYDGLRRNLNDVRHNVYKSDVFSLGFCFVYAATLSFKIIYEIRDVKDMKVMETILMNNLKERYSIKFIDCLLKMVEYDESKRLDFVQLNEYIGECFGDED